jgi:hypothetical protein
MNPAFFTQPRATSAMPMLLTQHVPPRSLSIVQTPIMQHITHPLPPAIQMLLLQTHINFPRFLPIFPGFLERLSHLAPIY